MIKRVFKGEQAILSELDLTRQKEERNKLLRFNQPRQDVQSTSVELTTNVVKDGGV